MEAWQAAAILGVGDPVSDQAERFAREGHTLAERAKRISGSDDIRGDAEDITDQVMRQMGITLPSKR